MKNLGLRSITDFRELLISSSEIKSAPKHNIRIMCSNSIIPTRAGGLTSALIRITTQLSVLLLGGLLTLSVRSAEEGFQPNSKEECLKATVRVKIVTFSGTVGYGSGFFLNEGEFTYVYTNAHVIDGADTIEMLDNDGEKVTGVDWIEAFAEPFGKFDGPSSGDCVRLKLSKRRDIAFTMGNQWDKLNAGCQIIVYGDNDGAFDGSQKIETLPGPLIDNSNGIIKYDCKSKQGSSGGAVVDANSFRVVALNTWVANLPKDPYQRMLGNKESDGVGIGVVLRDAKWRRFTTKDYLAQSKSIHRLQNNLELRILLTYLIPTAHGIYADLDSQFVAGMRVGDVITKYESNPTMRKLFELNSRIKKNPNSKIHKSNYDIYKTYLSTLNSILRERDGIMPNLQTEKLSYFHKTFLEKRLLTEGDSYYQDGIGACRDWFKDKIGVGGNVPVGVWETLPPFGEKLSKKIEQELLKK